MKNKPNEEEEEAKISNQALTEEELEEMRHNEWLLWKARERREKRMADEEAERKKKRIQAIKKSRVVG